MRYAGWVSLLGFIPLFLGLPLYWLSGRGPSHEEPEQGEPTPPARPAIVGDPDNDRIQAYS